MATVQLLYFAAFREHVGHASEFFPLDGVNTVAQIVQALRARGEPFAQMLAPERKWRVAVNQDMADLNTPIKVGDEIALFPPVTGG